MAMITVRLASVFLSREEKGIAQKALNETILIN